MQGTQSKLQQLFEQPGLGGLLAGLRRRLEAGRPFTGSITVQVSSDIERRALASLLGRLPSDGQKVKVDLKQLSLNLASAGLAEDLYSAAKHLFGPLDDLRRREDLKEQEWLRLILAAPPWIPSDCVAEFQKYLGKGARLRNLAADNLGKASELIDQLGQLIALLPTEGKMLAAIATIVTGNSHGLDRDQPLGKLAPSILGILRGCKDPIEGRDAERDEWALAGVMVDELSAPAAVLNLRAEGDDFLASILAQHAEAGEPFRLSTRHILRYQPLFSPHVTGPIVFITENINILAAAANQLGSKSAPLIATDGQEKTAVRLLLERLSAAGIELRYHGDFDWPGVTIAGTIMTRHAALPWRYYASDYLSAPAIETLEGTPKMTPWDFDLQKAMTDRGKVVHEEAVLDILLVDLSSEHRILE